VVVVENYESLDWFVYEGCYVLIACSGKVFNAKIYGVDDEKFVISDKDKDKVFEDSFKMVNEYLIQSKIDYVDRARKIPDLGQHNILEVLRMSDSVVTKDRVLLANSFKKYGYEKSLNFAFCGLNLYNVKRSGMLDLSRFLDLRRDVRSNKKIVLLPGLESKYFIFFKINSMFAVIDAVHDRNRDILRVEFDSENIKYGFGYEFSLCLNGDLVDIGYMKLSEKYNYIECEIVGCETIFNKLQKKYSVAIVDDFNLTNELLPGPWIGYNESIYEVMKCQIAAFIRHAINSSLDNSSIKNYCDEFWFPYLVQFFNSYAFVNDEILNFKIKDIEYAQYSSSMINLRSALGQDVGSFVGTRRDYGEKLTKEYFKKLVHIISQYEIVGRKCNTPENILQMCELCWDYVLGDDLRERVLFHIVKKILYNDFNCYADICKSFSELDNIDNIAKTFNMKEGYNSVDKIFCAPSPFINTRLGEIEKIAKDNNLPYLYRKKGSSRLKMQST
jgi:hypothetical protein